MFGKDTAGFENKRILEQMLLHLERQHSHLSAVKDTDGGVVIYQQSRQRNKFKYQNER